MQYRIAAFTRGPVDRRIGHRPDAFDAGWVRRRPSRLHPPLGPARLLSFARPSRSTARSRPTPRACTASRARASCRVARRPEFVAHRGRVRRELVSPEPSLPCGRPSREHEAASEPVLPLYRSAMGLAGFDLNLLKAFDALCAERHVTHAGQRIGLSNSGDERCAHPDCVRSSPAICSSVRSASGMQPTPRADDLAAPMSPALRLMRGVLQRTGSILRSPITRLPLRWSGRRDRRRCAVHSPHCRNA